MKHRIAGSGADFDWKREYFSIPNLMGYFRILLIPVFVVCYLGAETAADYYRAAGVLVLSALTDCFDGKVARRFNMVTDWGKFVDPLADKLTQAAVAICLTSRYPLMLWVVIAIFGKDLTLGFIGLFFLKKRGQKMNGAQWCGKVATVVLDVSLILLLLLPEIGYTGAAALCWLCIGFILYAFVSYLLYYWHLWQDGEERQQKSKRPAHPFRLLLLPLIFALYVLLGAVLPMTDQPEVSTQRQSEITAHLAQRNGEERAALIVDNVDALETRLAMIASAERTISLAAFDIQSDTGGLPLLSALYDAAERGVEVQLLVDGLRAWTNVYCNPYFYALSTHPNAELRLYNPVNPLTPWSLMGRMHDKYLIVDETMYLLGGRNARRFFLGETEGHQNIDWDVLVWDETPETGSLAELQDYFGGIWGSACTKVFHPVCSFVERPSVERAVQRLEADAAEWMPKAAAQERELTDRTSPVDSITLLSGSDSPYAKAPEVFYALSELIGQAQERVILHTPYVVCHDGMIDPLRKAAQTAEVTLMTNSTANNGNLIAASFYPQEKSRLLAAGVQLKEYDGGTSYHGKCGVIDDDLSLVGSFNYDLRSVYLDTELLLAIRSEAFCDQLRTEMACYEEDALTVVNAERSEAPAGHVPMTNSPIRTLMMNLVQLLLGWAKFAV